MRGERQRWGWWRACHCVRMSYCTSIGTTAKPRPPPFPLRWRRTRRCRFPPPLHSYVPLPLSNDRFTSFLLGLWSQNSRSSKRISLHTFRLRLCAIMTPSSLCPLLGVRPVQTQGWRNGTSSLLPLGSFNSTGPLPAPVLYLLSSASPSFSASPSRPARRGAYMGNPTIRSQTQILLLLKGHRTRSNWNQYKRCGKRSSGSMMRPAVVSH